MTNSRFVVRLSSPHSFVPSMQLWEPLCLPAFSFSSIDLRTRKQLAKWLVPSRLSHLAAVQTGPLLPVICRLSLQADWEVLLSNGTLSVSCRSSRPLGGQCFLPLTCHCHLPCQWPTSMSVPSKCRPEGEGIFLFLWPLPCHLLVSSVSWLSVSSGPFSSSSYTVEYRPSLVIVICQAKCQGNS